MVTLTASGVPRFRFPTREEWRTYMTSPGVLKTVIICVTLLISLFVGAIVFLAWSGHSTEALTTAIVTPLIAVLVNQTSRLRQLEQAVKDSPVIPTPEK